MYCILVTGIPAAGKSTLAGHLSECFDLPMISKDRIKEIMFDDIGFASRAEKVRLGVASMHIMYDMAEQIMKHNKPFILENNFENISREPLIRLLEKYAYKAITVMCTGDYSVIYKRFLDRNNSPSRHRGHAVNDSYPEKSPCRAVEPLSYEAFTSGIASRGMDSFVANGPHIVVDTTDFENIHLETLVQQIDDCRREILHSQHTH